MAQCGAGSVRFAKTAERQFALLAKQTQFPTQVYRSVMRTLSCGFDDFIMECENGFEVNNRQIY